jgi:hypothetical protein
MPIQQTAVRSIHPISYELKTIITLGLLIKLATHRLETLLQRTVTPPVSWWQVPGSSGLAPLTEAGGSLRPAAGRATAQAVSRPLHTAATRIRSQVRSWGICGGQRSTESGFHRVLRFLLPPLISPNALYSVRRRSNSPTGGWSTKWTQSYPTLRIKNVLEHHRPLVIQSNLWDKRAKEWHWKSNTENSALA